MKPSPELYRHYTVRPKLDLYVFITSLELYIMCIINLRFKTWLNKQQTNI